MQSASPKYQILLLTVATCLETVAVFYLTLTRYMLDNNPKFHTLADSSFLVSNIDSGLDNIPKLHSLKEG